MEKGSIYCYHTETIDLFRGFFFLGFWRIIKEALIDDWRLRQELMKNTKKTEKKHLAND